MKRVLMLSLAGLFMLAACQKDLNNENKNDGGGSIGQEEPSLFHTWVYDHPEEGITETLSFTETGVFYYSNKVTGVHEFENENVMGRYTRSGDDLLGTYTLNGMPLTMDFTIMELTECELTLRANDAGLTFTYNKYVGTVEVDFLDKVTPNYSELVSYDIVAYSSHNSEVAAVNVSTGEISAVGAGQCYVDVITKQGTVVVLIDVQTDIVDYSSFLGKTEAEIRAEFGDDIYKSTETKISYLLETGELVIFQFGVMPRVVITIGVDYNNSKTYSEEAMTAYLESKYTYSNDFSKDDIDSYMDVDGASLTRLSFVVNVIKGASQVVYNAVSFAPFKDHSMSLSRTRDEILALYGDDLYIDNDEWMVYDLTSVEAYISLLWLKFTDSVVSAVIAELNSAVDSSDIHTYLKSKYHYVEEYSNDVQLAYITYDETMVVFYDLNENAIYYILPQAEVKAEDFREICHSFRSRFN